MNFKNKFADKTYKYIYRHSGETILIKDIIEDTGFARATVHKYLKWLIRRQYVTKNGKKFSTADGFI